VGGGECVPIVEVFRTLCILHYPPSHRDISRDKARDGWVGWTRSVGRSTRSVDAVGRSIDSIGAMPTTTGARMRDGWMDGWMDAVRAVRANETVGKVVVVVEVVVVDIVA